jgi:hypothetical protein
VLLLLGSYGIYGLAPGWARIRDTKGLPVFKPLDEKEEEMKLSIVLAGKLTEALEVAGAVLQANRQLLETNNALRASMPNFQPQVDRPRINKPEIEKLQQTAVIPEQKMDTQKKAELLARLEKGRVQAAENRRLEEEKKREFVKRMQKAKAKKHKKEA